jgi:hypothetical protein
MANLDDVLANETGANYSGSRGPRGWIKDRLLDVSR